MMIKRFRIILSIIALLTVVAVQAQTTQPGIVHEYNEKAKKTPLAGVEVRAKSASNAVSGKDGSFKLEFLTLSPGSSVNISRIEKPGYEIFNKEAVEQWNIYPDKPFVVVMCRSDKFKKIRDNYEAKASANYKKQYDKEIVSLNKLKSEGKIKEEEYRKYLNEIQKNFDKQLENLNNYVDRYSRIDLSELSFLQDYFADYNLALDYYQKALKNSSRLYGLEHPDVANSYHTIGSIFKNKGDFDSALDWYKKSLAIREKAFGMDHPDVANSYNNIASALRDQGDYTNALNLFKKTLTIMEKVFGRNHPKTINISPKIKTVTGILSVQKL